MCRYRSSGSLCDPVPPMTPEEMDQVRPRLEAFAAEMLGGLARSDQRAKGELYLRGLMLDGKRKSMQPMAARLASIISSCSSSSPPRRGTTQRFGNGSPAGPMSSSTPDAYVIDDTGFPKDGSDSPGVARMYSGTLGKVGNCQIGVSVHAVTDAASAAINWRCSYRNRGTTPRPPTPRASRRSSGAGRDARSPTMCGIGRNGAWRWTCSTRSPARRQAPARRGPDDGRVFFFFFL